LGASLSLFKIYNYYSQHTKRGGASKRRIGTRELAQEREEEKASERERERERWWWCRGGGGGGVGSGCADRRR